MTPEEILRVMEEAPVIAAVKEPDALPAALASPARVVFVLCGTVLDIVDIIARVHAAGKLAIVHLDLIDGLAGRDAAVDYLAKAAAADGVISTRAGLLQRAKTHGLLTVRRFFLLDSRALAAMEKHMADPAERADCIEILPGILPGIIRRAAGGSCAVIAGGLIEQKADIVNALSAGAMAVSTTRSELWSQ